MAVFTSGTRHGCVHQWHTSWLCSPLARIMAVFATGTHGCVRHWHTSWLCSFGPCTHIWHTYYIMDLYFFCKRPQCNLSYLFLKDHNAISLFLRDNKVGLTSTWSQSALSLSAVISAPYHSPCHTRSARWAAIVSIIVLCDQQEEIICG